MRLTIDLAWLLDVQDQQLHDTPVVDDFSALQAAVARHAHDTVRLGHEADSAWCAAALLHTLIRLRPLPARNELFACMTAVAYMAAASEAIDPPYGALVELAQAIKGYKANVYDAADQLRSWRV